jgi:hypothetical protein
MARANGHGTKRPYLALSGRTVWQSFRLATLRVTAWARDTQQYD